MNDGVIDKSGFRFNVGIVISNQQGKLLWGRRIGSRNAWQFPQGGMHVGESPEEAMYRELTEELGLQPTEVECLGQTQEWLKYRLPKKFRRYDKKPRCIGQKQKWFLLRLSASDDCVRLDYSGEPEFDSWRWVDYWYPLEQVIVFKRSVYEKVLTEFEGLIRTS